MLHKVLSEAGNENSENPQKRQNPAKNGRKVPFRVTAFSPYKSGLKCTF